MSVPTPEDRFAGALIGTFVGDALGAPVEGMTGAAIHAVHGRLAEMLDGRIGKGCYTDDTQLMIGVAESLIEKKGFDGVDMASRFAANFDPGRGYGGGTRGLIAALKDGAEWDVPAKQLFGGKGSYGNGAAMRIAPVGVFFAEDKELLQKVAAAQAGITHTHPLGIDGAVIQAMAVGMAYRSAGEAIDRIEFVECLKGVAGTDVFIRQLDKVIGFMADSPEDEELVEEIGTDIKAHTSVPAALYCFLTHSNDLEEAVVHAVNLGGDTDTVGAMTGALAGARNGASNIPGRWMDDLECDGVTNDGKGLEYVIGVASRLFSSSSCYEKEGA